MLDVGLGDRQLVAGSAEEEEEQGSEEKERAVNA